MYEGRQVSLNEKEVIEGLSIMYLDIHTSIKNPIVMSYRVFYIASKTADLLR